MKKVLFVNHSLSHGGSEKVMTILANEFIRKGYEVGMIILESEEETYFVSDEICKYYFDSKNYKNVSYIWHCIKYIRKVIKDTKPDAVISFLIKINIMTIIADLGIDNVLLVSERAAPDFRKSKKQLMRFLENTVYCIADRVVVQTNQVKDMFVRNVAKKCWVIPNPIQSDIPEPFMGPKEKVIVAVGRLTKQKNFRMLINAYNSISRDFDEYKLFIFGEGEERENLQEQISTLGLEEKVKLPGFVSNVNEIIRLYSIFVSTSDFEGISNSMLEAMAMGMPIICTDCPVGGAAMMIDESNGILIPTNNQFELEKALRTILSDTDYALRIATNAVKVRKICSAESIANRWIECIESVE